MNDIREDLKAYLDGELAEDQAQAVASALASDPALQQEADLMKAMSETLKSMATEPEVSGAQKTLQKVRGRRRWNLWQFGTMGGAIALAVVAVAFFRGGGQPNFESADMAKTVATAPASEMPAEAGEAYAGKAEQAPSRGRAAGGGGMAADKGVLPVKSANESLDYPATSGAAAPSLNPLLIRTANLSVRVASSQSALVEAERIAKAQGGFTTGTHHSRTEGSLGTATATIRVPVRTFDAALNALRALGEVELDESNSDDVTMQVTDIEARLKVMRAEEDSYVTMLRAARRVGELLEIKERLSSVRQEIESLDSQRKALRNQASYSTINVTFTEKPRAGEPKPADWSGDTWSNAVNGLMGVLRALGQTVIYLFVYSPIWLPIVLVGWFVSRRLGK